MRTTRIFGYYRLVFGHNDKQEQIDFLRNMGVDVSTESTTLISETPKAPRNVRQAWNNLVNKVRSPDMIYVPYLECISKDLHTIAKDINNLVSRNITVTIGPYYYNQSKIGKENLNQLNYFASFQQNSKHEKIDETKKIRGRKGGRPRKISPDEIENVKNMSDVLGIKSAAVQYGVSEGTIRNYLKRYNVEHH